MYIANERHFLRTLSVVDVVVGFEQTLVTVGEAENQEWNQKFGLKLVTSALQPLCPLQGPSAVLFWYLPAFELDGDPLAKCLIECTLFLSTFLVLLHILPLHVKFLHSYINQVGATQPYVTVWVLIPSAYVERARDWL